MVYVSDTALGAPQRFEPLPPLASAEDILLDALPVLDPPSRMTVTEAAERYIRIQVQGVWQAFDSSVTPYMVEPTDATQSRRFKTVAFVGPSQSGKTAMLQNTAIHAPMCDASPVLIIHMSKGDRDKWVEDKLNPLIQNSPAVRDRLGKSRDDDTYSRKRFPGMRLSIGYPTNTVLSGGTYRMVLLTDYDHHPQVLGGKDNPEGSPYRMALQRVKTFLSRGTVLVESSPAYPVTDPSWHPSPAAPHMLPPVEGGVVPIFNEGTRGRWYWECPDCGDEFEPRFDRLRYDEALDPGEAGETAEMSCPHCGSLIAHRHKMALNRAALAGRGGWRHEARDGSLVTLHSAELRRTDVASYALNGAAATFATWRDLVANFETAKRKAAAFDDETDLATVHYTEIGVPFASKRDDGDDIGVTFLRDNGHDLPKGEVPGWARFLTVSVDVQGTYFAVQVMAWGAGGSGAVVDRYDISQPPEGAPLADRDAEGNVRLLKPGKYLEDWSVLEGILDRAWPVAGETYGLRPAAAVVDFHGEAGVSDNAEKFWLGRRAAGQGKRWFVSRGHGGIRTTDRFWLASPERKSGGGKARSIKLLNMATDRIKDTIFAMIARGASAEQGLILPRWMTDEQLNEFIGEKRIDGKGWEKKKGVVRNEGLDLSVMGRVLAEQIGIKKIDFDNPPSMALAGPDNAFAVALADRKGTDAPPVGDPSGPAPRKPRVHKISYLGRR